MVAADPSDRPRRSGRPEGEKSPKQTWTGLSSLSMEYLIFVFCSPIMRRWLWAVSSGGMKRADGKCGKHQ